MDASLSLNCYSFSYRDAAFLLFSHSSPVILSTLPLY